MGYLFYAVGLVVLLFIGFVAMQFLLVRRMRRLEGQQAPTLTGKAHKRITSGKPALFYFYSPGCGACRTMTPVVERLRSSRDGVFSIDISRDMDTARKFGVMATPTTVLIDNGVVRQVLVGPQPEKVLESAVAV